MGSAVPISVVAEKLSARFGLRLVSSLETLEGGVFDAVRLADMEIGPGFAILVARTRRQVEASFQADNFSGALLRTLSEAPESAQVSFRDSLSRAKDDGLVVNVSVNGEDIESMWGSADLWRRVEIDVSGLITRDREIGKVEVACASACLSAVFALLESEGKAIPVGEFEGAVVRAQANRYERSPVNRAACIEHFGPTCYVCKFDFERVYGPIGAGFIEVHHIVPVSAMAERVRVDPRRDLIPLCSNCHSMVHRIDPPMSPNKLMELVGIDKNPSVSE